MNVLIPLFNDTQYLRTYSLESYEDKNIANDIKKGIVV